MNSISRATRSPVCFASLINCLQHRFTHHITEMVSAYRKCTHNTITSNPQQAHCTHMFCSIENTVYKHLDPVTELCAQYYLVSQLLDCNSWLYQTNDGSRSFQPALRHVCSVLTLSLAPHNAKTVLDVAGACSILSLWPLRSYKPYLGCCKPKMQGTAREYQ